MPKSILIGIDSSDSSTAAIELGISWARQCDAMLVGLAVVDEESLRQAEPMPVVATAERDHRLVAMARRQADLQLEQFALRCAEAGVACKLLEDAGRPQDQLMLEAQRFDLLMLGQTLQFQFDTAFAEHEALRTVLKTSPRPVVVVPTPRAQGANVVIAYDGRAEASRALLAFQAANLPGLGEIHVVSIDADRVEAARRGDRAVEFLRSHSMTAQLHAFESSGAPAQLLIEQVTKLDAGLLVMGAYGRMALREMVFGSTTRTLLAECPAALFAFH